MISRTTSKLAWKEINENGLLQGKRLLAYNAYFQHGPCTSGELTHQMGLATNGYIPQIRARTTELKQMGVIQEVQERPCKLTGYKAIEWEVTANLPVDLPKVLTRKEKMELVINKVRDLWVKAGQDLRPDIAEIGADLKEVL